MSVDSSAGADADAPIGGRCSLCDRSIGSDDLILHCYPTADGERPAVAARDGYVGVCADCRADVDELLAAWTALATPPVDAAHSIAEGYRRVADDCSFCGRPVVDGPLLGVEYYPRTAGTGGDDAAAANYALCADCVPVFDEFLGQVRDDASG